MVLTWLLWNLLTFLLLLALTRWVARPRLGKHGLFDLFLVNMVGDLAAHTLFESRYRILTGLGSIALWITAITAVGYVAARWPGLHRLFYGRSQPVVSHGHADEGAMHRLGIGLAELESELRKQRVASLADAESVTVESDGSLAVFPVNPPVEELRRLADSLSALVRQLERQPPGKG